MPRTIEQILSQTLGETQLQLALVIERCERAEAQRDALRVEIAALQSTRTSEDRITLP